MQIETNAKLLSAESKPYNVDGNSGTSHKIRLNIYGEIFVCKSDEAQVQEMKEYIGKEGNAIIEVISRKENMALKLMSFV